MKFWKDSLFLYEKAMTRKQVWTAVTCLHFGFENSGTGPYGRVPPPGWLKSRPGLFIPPMYYEMTRDLSRREPPENCGANPCIYVSFLPFSRF